MKSILLFLLTASLFTAFVGDLLQFSTRTTSSILRIADASTHLSSLSMLINRVGAATALLLIGYLLDTGTNSKTLATAFCVFLLMISAVYFIYSIYLTKFILLESRLIAKLYSLPNIDILTEGKRAKIEHRYSNIAKPAFYDISLVYCISLLGFLLPSIAASHYVEYRATLLQSGFILNSLSTIYFTLVCERKQAHILINASSAEKIMFTKVFMRSRSLGTLLSVTILVSASLFM